MPPKAAIGIGAALAAIWLIVVCQLAARFNIPSGDGILYSLPFAAAKHPFDLGIPFLDNFDGYGSSWGHHWPGAMWLKGMVFFVLPYSRTADVALLSVFQLLAAVTAAWVVWKTTARVWPAAAALVLLLSDRLLVVACAGNRFEPIAVAVVVALLAHCVTGCGNRGAGWRVATCLLFFLCPTLHPYALVLGGIILGFDCLSHGRRHGGDCVLRAGAFALGCLAVIAWFVIQPDALRQFTANLAIQKSFYHDWNSVWDGLGNYRLGGGWMLWLAGLAAAGLLMAGWNSARNASQLPLSPALRFLAPALLIAVITIHTVTRCENFHYLAFGTPFVVIMVCVLAARIVHGPASARHPDPGGTNCGFRSMLRWLSAAVLGILVLVHATILPFRVLQFVRAGCPDINAEISSVLDRIPANRAVFIPHLMWPAATHDRTHEICWFTFPVASPRQVRAHYERLAYAKAKPGDILIVDNLGAAGPDLFGLYPTFPLLPPDPARWKLTDTTKHLYHGSVTWGLDLSVYEFGGHE